MPNSVEEDVIARYGKTYQWRETGYITPSGVRIDRKGDTIAGSKRKAVTRLLNNLSLTRAEKALILAYLGYSVTDYAGLIKRYIGSIGLTTIGLTKEKQKALLAYFSA